MDYYQTLGVSPTATDEEIKAAFRRRAKQLHPDSGGDEAQFKQLNEAYDVLKDPAKRSQYDHVRSGQGRVHVNINGMHSDIFNDIWQELYNVHNFRQARRPRRNRDLNISLTLQLQDLLTEQRKTLSVRQQNGDRKLVDVTIPAGVKPETTLKYRNLGDATHNDLPTGDFYVTIQVDPHPQFTPAGTDLNTQVTIDAFQAMVGCTVEIVTLEGRKLSLTVPPGTQYGTVMGIPGYGLPNKTGERGKILVKLLVKIPENLTQERLNTIRKMMGVDIEV